MIVDRSDHRYILAEHEWLSSFGRTDEQIAAQLGLPLDTLQTVLRRHGLHAVED